MGTISIDTALRLLAEEYELNASIYGFYDCGFEVRLGDELNGILATRNFTAQELDQVGAWLLAEAATQKRRLPPPDDDGSLAERLDEVAANVGLRPGTSRREPDEGT
jgi:hypothetical protein